MVSLLLPIHHLLKHIARSRIAGIETGAATENQEEENFSNAVAVEAMAVAEDMIIAVAAGADIKRNDTKLRKGI